MQTGREGIFRVVSLNVCRLGTTTRRGRARAQSLETLLGALDADVVALQELRHRGNGEQFTPPWFGGHMHVALGGHSTSGVQGIGVLCRTPYLEQSQGRLPARRGDDKGYVRVVVSPSTLGCAVEIIALHLDPVSLRARRRQIAMLAREVGLARGPRLVAGDLNAMSARALVERKRYDETVDELSDALGVKQDEALTTFPNRYPCFSLDWIMASPHLSFQDVRTVRADFSDHAAMVADVRVTVAPSTSAAH